MERKRESYKERERLVNYRNIFCRYKIHVIVDKLLFKNSAKVGLPCGEQHSGAIVAVLSLSLTPYFSYFLSLDTNQHQ
jgi:hypothetical protein